MTHRLFSHRLFPFLRDRLCYFAAPSPEQMPANIPDAGKAEKSDMRSVGAEKIPDADPLQTVEPKRQEKLAQANAVSGKMTQELQRVDRRVVETRQELLEQRGTRSV